MSNRFGNVNLISSGSQLELYCAPGMSAPYSIAFPNAAPGNNQTWRYNASTQQFEWVNLAQDISLGLNAPNAEFQVTGSPYGGGTGTITIVWNNQTQNLFLASPNGVTGKPSFRAIVEADLPASISASRINGLLNKANIPSGTNATSFQIDSANAGVVLKNDVGSLKVYNSDQTALTDIYCNKLFVLNGVDQSDVTTVNLGDSVLLLNANFTTGTPIANSGFSVRRGSAVNATLQWNEASDTFEFGTDDNLKTGVRKSIALVTNTDLVTGVYTFNHNLREQYPIVEIIDNTNRKIGLDVTFVNVNTCTVNFARLTPLTGTWKIIAEG